MRGDHQESGGEGVGENGAEDASLYLGVEEQSVLNKKIGAGLSAGCSDGKGEGGDHCFCSPERKGEKKEENCYFKKTLGGKKRKRHFETKKKKKKKKGAL